MVFELVLASVLTESRAGEPLALTPAQARLRKMVLDAVPSPHSKRNYAKALDHLFQFCASRPLSRSLLMEWRTGREYLSALNRHLAASPSPAGSSMDRGRHRRRAAAAFGLEEREGQSRHVERLGGLVGS